MGVIRKIADRIELYDPRTGERFFHYDETANEISADKPLNAGSVNTNDATITQSLKGDGLTVSSDGTTPTEILRHESGGATIFEERSAVTVAGDNTAQPVLQTSGESGYFVASGDLVSGSGNRFTDIIIVSAATITVVQKNGQVSAPTRSYSGRLDISIDDAGNDYNIAAASMGVSP